MELLSVGSGFLYAHTDPGEYPLFRGAAQPCQPLLFAGRLDRWPLRRPESTACLPTLPHQHCSIDQHECNNQDHGCFHEDGLADMCDGLGGGMSQEQA